MTATECRDAVARQRRALRRAARASHDAEAKATEALAAVAAETDRVLASTELTRRKIAELERQITDLVGELPGSTP